MQTQGDFPRMKACCQWVMEAAYFEQGRKDGAEDLGRIGQLSIVSTRRVRSPTSCVLRRTTCRPERASPRIVEGVRHCQTTRTRWWEPRIGRWVMMVVVRWRGWWVVGITSCEEHKVRSKLRAV